MKEFRFAGLGDTSALVVLAGGQVIIKRNQGILKINDTHTYDTTLRGDIYLECILVDPYSKSN